MKESEENLKSSTIALFTTIVASRNKSSIQLVDAIVIFDGMPDGSRQKSVFVRPD